MINELNVQVKKLKGSVLLIGFDEQDIIVKCLNTNKEVVLFSHLTDDSNRSIFKNKKKKKFFGNKTINIKKLYKELKKEKYDYIVCDFKIIKKYLDNFIRNSYKITNKKIYFIVNEDIYDYEEIEKRYSRYNASCVSKGSKEEYLITIDVSEMKMPLIRRILYRFRDIGYNIIEFISNVIIS